MNARCVRCIQSDAFLCGRPPHSASEHVECVPNGIETQVDAQRIPANCVREDRKVGRYGAKAETQDHNQQEVYPAGKKFRMSSYSTHRLNSDTSRITLSSLNLPVSIPPQHKNCVVIICRPCHDPSAQNLRVRLSSAFFLHKRVRSSTVS